MKGLLIALLVFHLFGAGTRVDHPEESLNAPIRDICRASDGPDRCVDFVRDAGYEVTERGHFLPQDQMVLRFLQIGHRFFEGVIFLTEVACSFFDSRFEVV